MSNYPGEIGDLLQSFNHFEAETAPERKCATCNISPEYLAAVNELINQGKATPTILRWLNARGIELSLSKLRHHYREGHAK